MKRVIVPAPLALSVGILLVFPTLYFIVSAWLNYGLGLPGLWKVIEPIFDMPKNNHLGFNINLLILFGPLLALFINIPHVITLQISYNTEDLNLQFAAKKYSWNWLIVAVSIFCLSFTCLYLAVENCFC